MRARQPLAPGTLVGQLSFETADELAGWWRALEATRQLTRTMRLREARRDVSTF